MLGKTYFSVLGLYLDFQQKQGRTLEACEISVAVVERGKVVDQLEEMYIYVDIISVLGICDFQGGIEDGLKKGEDYFALANALIYF